MGKGLRRVLLTVWILAGILAGWQSIQKSRVPLDRKGGGDSLLA